MGQKSVSRGLARTIAILAIAVLVTQLARPKLTNPQIPNQVISAEFVFIQAGHDGYPAYSYERYEGTPLTKESDLQASTSKERAAYMVSQRAAVMP